MNRERYFKRLRQGFTLIELLCAMALFSIVAGALLSILNSTSDTWSHTKERIDSRRSGRSILGQISAELELAYLPPKQNVYFSNATALPQGEGLGYQFIVNPPKLSAHGKPHIFFWQAPIDSEKGGRHPSVGYFVRWLPGTTPKAILCRMYIPDDSDNINKSLYGRQDSKYALSNPNGWIDVIDDYITNTAVGEAEIGYEGWFADNVIGLWIQCYDPLGNRIVNDVFGESCVNSFDSTRGYTYTSGTSALKRTAYPLAGGAFNVRPSLPYSAEIGIVLLDDKHAEKLTSIPDYSKSKYFTADFQSGIQAFVDDLPGNVRSGAKIFTTRIEFLNK